jgi:membrane fusion protein (multidrug efflux system)
MDSAGPEPARIEAIDALVDPSTRNAEVRARVRNERVAAPGASVRVTVPLGQPRPAVGIPVSALRRGPEGTHVWVIEADSAGKPRAHLRPVVAGDVLGDEVLILRGVAVGDTVAASGSFKLRDGALVASQVATAEGR